MGVLVSAVIADTPPNGWHNLNVSVQAAARAIQKFKNLHCANESSSQPVWNSQTPRSEKLPARVFEGRCVFVPLEVRISANSSFLALPLPTSLKRVAGTATLASAVLFK